MIVFNNISLKRGQTELLENATATINPKQKVGLVGKNGCGKSSLFALLKKELTPEGGEVTYPSNWRVSWVNQETPALDIPAIDYVIQGDREYCRLQQELDEANERNDGHAIARIHGQLETLDAWTIQSRAASLLHGLGFSQDEFAQPVKSFSGGWRMRLNLAQALLCPSDLLLLDEPTNHLDLDAVIWLERWLVQYQGTLVLISHDRDFLDPIVTKILHIENQNRRPLVRRCWRNSILRKLNHRLAVTLLSSLTATARQVTKFYTWKTSLRLLTDKYCLRMWTSTLPKTIK